MSAILQNFATTLYRQAARVSAGMLASSPMVESVLLHRSAATGEVFFGRSDIDVLVMLDEQDAEDGAKLASFYKTVQRVRRFNPALNHIDVYQPSGIQSYAKVDTLWASVERRSQVLLRGRPLELPSDPVHPDHALSRFLLWVEWFFAIAVQQRNRRNLRKISLECWNTYASAEGLIPEPYVLRSEMEAQARRSESGLVTERLADPSHAVRFVFELADRLHRSRLPALQTLAKPVVFDAVIAPLCLARRFVVLPRADFPLPPDAFVPGAFPCTPEILDLFLHAKNALLDWILPRELREIGIRPPTVTEVLHSCAFYGHRRFLLYPGFGDPSPPKQAARLAIIRHALDSASSGELPPPIPQDTIREMMAAAPSIEDYFRTQYDSLRRDTLRLDESLRALASSTACP